MLFKQDYPDASRPPVDKDSPYYVNWLRVLLVVIVIAVVGYFTQPKVMCGPKDPLVGKVVSDARQIGIGLNEFKEKYGTYPDASTIRRVKDDTGTSLRLGTHSSNDFFRQLLAAKLIQSGGIFKLRNVPWYGSPSPQAAMTTLKAGECDYAYILGALPSDTRRPIVVARLMPDTSHFDPKAFKKPKAVVLRADNSSQILSINKNGDIFSDGGKLFDPANPIWEGRPPVIVWPE